MESSEFSNRVMALLADRGMKMTELAKATGIPYYRLYSALKRPAAIPNGKDLETLTNFFGVPPGYLMTGSPSLEDINRQSTLEHRLKALEPQHLVELEKFLEFLESKANK